MGLAALLARACALLLPWTAATMRADRLALLRQETVDMFYHGYSNYMQHAFPEDELRPITCAPLTRDRENPGRIGLNDALGNYSLTLIDSLSTLAILAGGPQDGSYTGPQALGDFQDGIAQFVHYYGDGRVGKPSGTGIRATGFDLDSKVQVFETVIRGVGGLLSAHLFAIGELPIPGYVPKPSNGFSDEDDPLELAPIPWPNGFRYDGQLLRLALDLAQRLLPAFYTPTGIPYPRVNLRSGIPFYINSPLHQAQGSEAQDPDPDGRREVTETCSAGAGSLTLEFTVLSRLTGDARFEQAAKRAFWEVWHRRSEIGLIGNGIDAEHGVWIGPHAGIGAGMDSFFEYALKSHILLSGHEIPNSTTSANDHGRRRRRTDKDWLDPGSLHGPLPPEMHSSEAFLQAWHEAHASVKRHLYTDQSHHPYYANSHRATGQPYTMWIDSLGAFYPGLLALAGEVDEAIEANLVYTALWTRYAALPERWSIRENNVEAGIAWWPGRPEFIESTYHIYRATRDPWYLHVGEMVLRDIRRRCHAPCGWAGLQDVRTGEKQDRMESFFLGETTKYMYLLFDLEHPLNNLDAAYVFTTEGHPLILPKQTRSAPLKQWRPQAQGQGEKGVSLFQYLDDGFTRTCPVPPKVDSLTGSATAARPQLFDASRFTDLFNTPNLHGPIEAVEIEVDDDENQDDEEQGELDRDGIRVPRVGRRKVTRYRPASNHSLFPWTLPPSMLPVNGTCAAPMMRVLSAIEFPARDAASALASKFGASLVWHHFAGPVVQNLEGLKLQLEREPAASTGADDGDGPVWRITHVGATQLGRQGTVFFHAEHVRNLKDEAFTCIRRHDAVEVELLVDVQHHTDNATTTGFATGGATISSDASSFLSSSSSSNDLPAPLPSESLLKHLLRAVSSVFEPSQTDLPAGDPPSPPRGGCSFSQKLANIPSYSPSPSSLQLVVVVDEVPADRASAEPLARTDGDDVVDDDEGGHLDDDEGAAMFSRLDPSALDRPMLAVEQLTPKGMKRLRGVPMVLLRGHEGDYERFGRALAAGIRRKYRVESQGLAIANAVVM
ncbi:hypothetical protein HIM_03109 [Hirsutella minnesotensis 3608]|nr:hypothetical protein HIM_03109 [Hirsutella minnesotensis 3608]